MTVKQLSVFLENKTGRINEVTRILGENGVNMRAFSIAESADFGLMRVVTEDVDRAVQVLRDNDFSVRITDVICINCPNKAGELSKILELLASENIFIEYMYAFSEGETASVVIRPNDTEKCIEVLSRHGLV